jgi:TonB family protein
MPDDLVIARRSFIDIGPPFDFYEVIKVQSSEDGLRVERVLLTPPGQACVQPATVESETVTLHKSMNEFLANKNPCAIPEKDLYRELKRCKKCLVFSGVNVTMEALCGNQDRLIRMDILDRNLFDSAPNTPENTSWTMALLGELDKALGPGAFDKPIFPMGSPAQLTVPDTELVREIEGGKFDALFGKEHEVAKVVSQAREAPPPPPSVKIESVTPIAPVSTEMPIYPPIAKAAHVEGLVDVTFDVDTNGRVQDVVLVDGPKLAELGVKDAISKWNFPRSAWGNSGRASIRFSLNCY